MIIRINNKSLTEFPPLDPWANVLICDHNKFVQVDQLSQLLFLKEIYCSNNLIKKLPPLADCLKVLDCHNNNLIELPQLPNSLSNMRCDGNPFKEFTNIPNSLKRIWISPWQISGFLNKLTNPKTIVIISNISFE